MLKSFIFKLVKLCDRIGARLPKIGPFQPIRGSFSAYDRLNNGIYDGCVIYSEQAVGPCDPGSITERCGLKQHDHQPWPLFWTVTHDARLVGSMWHWRDPNNLICEEGVYGLVSRRRLSEDRITSQWFPGKAQNLSGAWMSLASNWGDGRNYYHWILDSLTRLRLRDDLPETTKILLPKSDAPYMRETLELLGLWKFVEQPRANHVAPERFYFCSPTAMTGVWNPEGFNWLRKRFSPYFSDQCVNRRVFLTRRGTNRIPEELANIEKQFEMAGFQIVNPGEMSVLEQIKLISGAEAVAGIHGAAMTNILWAREGTPVLELFGNSYLNACYEVIAIQGGLNYSAAHHDVAEDRELIAEWISKVADGRDIN